MDVKGGFPRSSSGFYSVLLFVVFVTCSVFLWLAAAGASAQQDDDGAAQEQYSNSEGSQDVCPNPNRLLNIEAQTENRVVPFETAGRTFRVNYSVDFTDDEGSANGLDIDVEDGSGGLVEFENVFEDQEGSFIVTEGAGAYELVTRVSPDDGAIYSVSVEDCLEAAGDQNGGDPQSGVITSTVPDKVLVNTGGEAGSPRASGVVALLSVAGLFCVFGVAAISVGGRRG
jgi:hypothetical protein